MDFHLFVKLILHLQYGASRQAREFLVALFDVDGDGFVGPLDIEYFYRAIRRESGMPLDEENPSLDVGIAEIFDMCQSPCSGFDARILGESGSQAKITLGLIDIYTFKNDHEQDAS
jgi:hypothetical protein